MPPLFANFLFPRALSPSDFGMSPRCCNCHRPFARRRISALPGLWCALAAGIFLFSGCQSLSQRSKASQQLTQSRQLSQRGLNAIERGDLSSAEELLEAAVETCPVDSDARRHYAEVLWKRNQREQALRQAEEALATAPDDLALAIRVGQMQLDLGQLDRAQLTADQVLDSSHKDADAWALHGRVAMARGDLERALADFQRALEFRKDDRQLLWETAELYRRMNRPQRALSTLNSLGETFNPGEEPQKLLYLKGLALSALDRPEDASDSFALAMMRGPATPELLYRLSEAQLASGHREIAAKTLEQALAADPKHPGSVALRQRLEVATRPLDGIRP